MQEATQFCVGLENRTGALAALCATLRKAEINIEALFVSNDSDGVWVNLVVDRSEAAEQALLEGGFHFVPEKVLVVETESRPGGLEQIAADLSAAEVDIRYVYGSGTLGTRFILILSVDDFARAADILSVTQSSIH